MEVKVREKCSDCDGTGKAPWLFEHRPEWKLTCLPCGGSGYFEKWIDPAELLKETHGPVNGST